MGNEWKIKHMSNYLGHTQLTTKRGADDGEIEDQQDMQIISGV